MHYKHANGNQTEKKGAEQDHNWLCFSKRMDVNFEKGGLRLVGNNFGDIKKNASLVVDYRFDECAWSGVAGEVKDSSENGYHLTGINLANTVKDGLILRAGSFDGVEKVVRGDVDIAIDRELTVNLWMKSKGKQTNEYARVFELSKNGNNKYSTTLAFNKDGTTLNLWTTSKLNYRSTATSYNLLSNGFLDGAWHMYTFTYNRGKIKLYIDAILKKQVNGVDKKDIADVKKLSIGGYYSASEYMFKGGIDEVKFFTKELDIDDIKTLKNQSAVGRDSTACENIYSLSGKVYQDINDNGSFDSGDSVMPNITVKLFADTNGNGVYDDEIDTQERNVSTLDKGGYRFIDLPVGKYIVMVDTNDKDVPSGYTILDNKPTIAIDLQNESVDNDFIFVKANALPLGCVDDGLMFQKEPTDVSYLDLTNAVLTLKKSAISSDNINGVGYNKKDGFFWGYNYTKSDGTVARIGKDSKGELIIDYFKIANLNTTSYTGDIDSKGHLYLKEQLSNKKVSVVDLDPNSKNYLKKIRSFNLGKNITISDWSFNPEDGKLYAVNNDSGVKYLYKIDPQSGAIISKQNTKLSSEKYGVGASFFDKNGFFYIYNNKTGDIFRIDVDKSPVAVLFSSGEVIELNDGAMCTDVEIRFDFGDLPTSYATSLE